MAKFLDENGLLYFWQKIVNKFVAKEDGKGLSTNDYTTAEKEKLAGIEAGANKYTLPTASADTLGGVKVGAGLVISGQGVLSATGGGTADAVDWANVQSKPTTIEGYGITDAYTKLEIDGKGYLVAADIANKADKATTLEGYGITDAAHIDHNHDGTYLKLSGGTMTGPIQFSDDRGQITSSSSTAEAKIDVGSSSTEIVFTDKQNDKTNRVTVSATGAEISVGETTPGDNTGTKITIDMTNGVKIPMVATPVEERDAANKKYVDDAVANKANASTTLAGYGITDAYTKTEIDGKGYLVASDIVNKADKADTLAGYGITDAYTKTEVDGKLSSVYKPAGNVYFANLPTPSASNLGFVYSMLDAFTTDERFVASEPTQYPIGTNVVVVAVESGDSGTQYLFDVLAGFVDLSGYLKKTDLVAITNMEIDEIVA